MTDYPDLVLQICCDICGDWFADLDCCADKRKPQLVIEKLEKTGECVECFVDVFGDYFFYTGEDEIICEDCYGDYK